MHLHLSIRDRRDSVGPGGGSGGPSSADERTARAHETGIMVGYFMGCLFVFCVARLGFHKYRREGLGWRWGWRGLGAVLGMSFVVATGLWIPLLAYRGVEELVKRWKKRKQRRLAAAAAARAVASGDDTVMVEARRNAASPTSSSRDIGTMMTGDSDAGIQQHVPPAATVRSGSSTAEAARDANETTATRQGDTTV